MNAAYFAGGCFWCVTPIFAEQPGVSKVISGYSGGQEVNPSYEDVKHQKTGHRETICIQYDPSQISFASLLEIFLENVDPYDPDGQYIDRGFSYTLAVYYQNIEELEITNSRLKQLAETSGKEVYISVEPFSAFYDAEEYHQDYYKKNPVAFEEELINSGRKKG